MDKEPINREDGSDQKKDVDCLHNVLPSIHPVFLWMPIKKDRSPGSTFKYINPTRRRSLKKSLALKANDGMEWPDRSWNKYHENQTPRTQRQIPKEKLKGEEKKKFRADVIL